MAEPEYVKVTITVEKEDGSKTEVVVPKAHSTVLDTKYTDPKIFNGMFVGRPELELLTFSMEPMKDEDGVMYFIKETDE